VTCGRPLIFSKYSDKADRHDITEILLKVALNTITHYNYEKKVKTVMVNNSTNINETKNHGGQLYQSTWRKSAACHKSLTNFITKCCIKYTLPLAGLEPTTLVP
jgi:hypothetical protein